jgi:hypothetical protein
VIVGVVVYKTGDDEEVAGRKKAPTVYMGEGVIKDYPPPAVFSVIGLRRSNWDDW